MKVNTLPRYDRTDNPTQCCPRFHPENWEGQEIHLKDKPFAKVRAYSMFHVPLNLKKVYQEARKTIEKAGALAEDEYMILTHEPAPGQSEHLFAVDKDIPGMEMIHMEGEFMTHVFEGPPRDVSKYQKEMEEFVTQQGRKPEKTYFFFTTCPKCTEHYGANYIVGITKVKAKAEEKAA